MIKKALFFIFLFLFLTLLQISFFNFVNIFPNLVLIAFLVILFFQKNNLSWGLFFVLLAGTLLDVFSGSFFGVNILSLLLIYLIFILILNFIFDANIIEAILLIILGIVLYNFLVPTLSFVMGKIFGSTLPLQFNLNYLNIIARAIDLILGIALFFGISMSQRIIKFVSPK